MELFAKIVRDFYLLTIVIKNSILDAGQGSEDAAEITYCLNVCAVGISDIWFTLLGKFIFNLTDRS